MLLKHFLNLAQMTTTSPDCYDGAMELGPGHYTAGFWGSTVIPHGIQMAGVHAEMEALYSRSCARASLFSLAPGEAATTTHDLF